MKILDRLPIPKDRMSLRFGDRYIAIRADQILVWMSIHLTAVLELEDNIPRFPALVDTGSNVGFSIQERHLREWAGIDPGLLEVRGEITIEGKVVTRREAAVWLYPNIPGRQEVARGRPPFRLDLRKGIAVHTPDALPPGPRLPLLGFPPCSTTTWTGGSIPSGGRSPCRRAPGAGRSSVSSAECDAIREGLASLRLIPVAVGVRSPTDVGAIWPARDSAGAWKGWTMVGSDRRARDDARTWNG
jgi:hypothetical protein